MPTIACRAKPSCERVGDRDDLHHAAVDQPLDALADGGLGQPDDLADRGVRAPAVLLELLDDRLGDVVEDLALARSCAYPLMARNVTARVGMRLRLCNAAIRERISLRRGYDTTGSLV